MKKILLTTLLFLLIIGVRANDLIIFGNDKSEQKHLLTSTYSETYNGGLGETARRMTPVADGDWQGGHIGFEMRVDPQAQNYLTVRCWGSEADDAVVMLFANGKQIGYRHLGDYDLLHRGNKGEPCRGKFYYVTLPLPLQMTEGQQQIALELRAYGNTWDYGDTFERFQHPMTGSTIGFYRAYTHTDKFFQPDKGERQGSNLLPTALPRTSPSAELIDQLKEKLCQRISGLLQRQGELGQQDVWLLADAYGVTWTPAYHNPLVVKRVVAAIDAMCDRQAAQPDIVYKDGSVYNADWMTTALLARSVRSLWSELDNSLRDTERRQRWVKLFKASVEYGITHRRQYTNQSMIIDMASYENNRALLLLDCNAAQPEFQMLRYLYESLGIVPWSGVMLPNGEQAWPLGRDYWQLTARGLTKELGYVGYYGEVTDWVCHIYRATCLPGIPLSGDTKIREQLLHIAAARYPFRYPALDDDGYRCMRAETLIGWRDGNHYPGDVMYGDRGSAWDANPIMTATLTRDPQAIAIAQQMVDDGQLWNLIAKKMTEINNPRVAQSLLHLPENIESFKDIHASAGTMGLPMSVGSADFIFADEEDGVVAIKHGEERLYVSLYWRARMGINRLCKIHYMTPVMERVANVFVDDVQFTPSGLTYTRPERNNMEFFATREFYPDIQSAHTGEQLPIARIPDGISFKPGQENAYAGKADFYRLDYGPYIICMNSSATKSVEVSQPKGYTLMATTAELEKTATSYNLPPRSTIVLLKQ